MRHEGTVSLFQYWNRLRDRRAAPRRTEIEPADIKKMLADTFILETDARREAVFRLAGTRLCALFGRELKGFAFNSLWALKDQRVVARLIHDALHRDSVVVITVDAVTRTDRHTSLELIALPLEGGGDSPRALGSIVSTEKPFWLGADPIVECRVDTLRVVDPNLEPTFLRNRPALRVPSFMPEMPARGEASAGGRRVRHLVVLDGGRDPSPAKPA